MIVVVVAAILAIIAFPSYQEQVRKGRRASGRAALTEATSRQEQFFLDNKSYTTTIGTGGLNMDVATEGGFYVLAVEVPDADCPVDRCYELSASPQGAQETDSCSTLSIDSDRLKNPAGCW
jgi:type IV pilus assembly protein PilE